MFIKCVMDGKGEKEKGREKEKKGGVRGEVGRGRSCLSKREMGGNNSGCKQEKLPTACFSGGVAWIVSYRDRTDHYTRDPVISALVNHTKSLWNILSLQVPKQMQIKTITALQCTEDRSCHGSWGFSLQIH